MSFYDLPKEKRDILVEEIYNNLKEDFKKNHSVIFLEYASDEDTYIRKACYLGVGKIYFNYLKLQPVIINLLEKSFSNENPKVRQTIVNAFGEIGKKEAEKILPTFDKAIHDDHHSVRNAVIGSLKKMGQVNPKPILAFSKKYLHDPDVEIRRQAIHGMELRGRTHPEEIMPLLQECEFDEKLKIRKMVIHVLIQISYKKGCLEVVLDNLKTWKNKELVDKALAEILHKHVIDSHFTYYSPAQAKKVIQVKFPHFMVK